MNLSFGNLFKIPEIRNKILITLGLLLVYRIGFFIPLPGVDTAEALRQTKNLGALGQLFGMMNVLTGGSLQSATLFSLGVMPYISASIIFSLLAKAVPALEKVAKEGQSGQRKINQWTRMATVAICLIQSWFVILGPLGAESSKLLQAGVREWFGVYCIVVMVALTAGTMFVMWLGEQITEHGIGNGISLIIMAGIVSNLYPAIGTYFDYGMDRDAWQRLLLFLGAWGLAVVVVVYMTKAQRRIPIQQAKHTRGRRVYGGQRHFLPFKVNQAGVMPIIFGSALLVIPAMVGKALGWTWLEISFGGQRGFWFVLCYTVLIFFFSFFWTSMMFQPNEIANNLKEGGSFIPGIRPGKPTAQFLEQTMVRITIAGAAFLAIVAVLPSFFGAGSAAGMDQVLLYFMSGTSILIVVSVALDMVEKLNAMLVMRNYEGFLEEGQQPARGAAAGKGAGQGAAATGGWGRRSN
ncbi:MAG: preprotein translocase subunit SecY [Planctomycetes bacterium]|nr:preprotein translocase subunit SecY [Planctomycetota bacterium]